MLKVAEAETECNCDKNIVKNVDTNDDVVVMIPDVCNHTTVIVNDDSPIFSQ